MPHRPVPEPERAPRARLRRATRRFTLAGLGATVLAVIGIITSLYPEPGRTAVTIVCRAFLAILPFAVVAAAASLSTVWICRRIYRRPQLRVNTGRIAIQSDATVRDVNDLIVGRSLSYLEVRRDSQDVVVFLHGLGLDASDFRPYLTESTFHCIALTLFGFNASEKQSSSYRPISLQAHLDLVVYALRKFRREHPNRRMSVVGFSFGADMCLLLARPPGDALKELRLHRVVLLDPNVNNQTTTISAKIAKINDDDPGTELIDVLTSAGTPEEFRYLCEYLVKITSKSFPQVRRHARDVIARYPDESFDFFLSAYKGLQAGTDGVHVVLSANHEQVFNAVVQAATARGLATATMHCTPSSHFELIAPAFLTDFLNGILPPSSP